MIQPGQNRLEGKVAIVAGGGCIGEGWGNGKATAVGFARNGASVFVLDHRLEAAEDTAHLIRSEGGSAQAFRCDVSVSADIEDAIAACVQAFGKLDILLNNVGIGTIGGPIDTLEEDWDRTFAVNVKSAFLLAKHGIPELLKREKSCIVNVSTAASIMYGGVPYIAYAASKAALNQLTRYIGLQYAAQGLRANCILPGLIETPMAYASAVKGYSSTSSIEEMKRRRAALSPTGSEGTAWDIANAALYLASEESSYVNAALLVVDGGYSAGGPGPQHVL